MVKRASLRVAGSHTHRTLCARCPVRSSWEYSELRTPSSTRPSPPSVLTLTRRSDPSSSFWSGATAPTSWTGRVMTSFRGPRGWGRARRTSAPRATLSLRATTPPCPLRGGSSGTVKVTISIYVCVSAVTLSSCCRGAGAPATTETQGAQQRQASLSRSWRPRPLRAPRVARPPWPQPERPERERTFPELYPSSSANKTQAELDALCWGWHHSVVNIRTFIVKYSWSELGICIGDCDDLCVQCVHTKFLYI